MNKHIKVYEDFINEAMATADTKTNGRGFNWRITPEILIEAGVEFPNVNIDMKKLEGLQDTLVSKLREMYSLRKVAADGHDVSAPAKKVEKEIEEAVKKYNEEAKNKFKEFARAVQAVKFPSDAGYSVNVEEMSMPSMDRMNSYEPSRDRNPDSYYQDLEKKKKIDIFDGKVTVSYEILPTGRRKVQKWGGDEPRFWWLLDITRGNSAWENVTLTANSPHGQHKINTNFLKFYVGYKSQ
jgi:hypothetical protein